MFGVMFMLFKLGSNISLIHNIDYVIAALCVLIVVFVTVGRKYRGISKSNKVFFLLLITSIFMCVVDILMNVFETYTNIFAYEYSYLCRFLYNSCTVLLSIFSYLYVKSYSPQKEKVHLLRKLMDLIVWILTIVYVILALINFNNGWIMYFDANGGYHTGRLYYIVYAVPMVLLVFMIIVTLEEKKNYSKTQLRAIMVYILLVVVGVVYEAVFAGDTLTIMFAISLAILVIQFSLETPDYKKMNDAIEELKKSNEEVKLAKDEADRANQAKSDFLARMSHEIRTPMNAIIGMNEMIIKESDSKEVVEYASDAKQAADHLLSIINDILDFSKIESGKMEIIEEELDVAKTIKELYSIFKVKMDKKGLDFYYIVDEKLPSVVYADMVRIKQILTNLINNAEKYTQKGEITVKFEMLENKGDVVKNRITVKDTGAGIRREDMDKLYTLFERIDERINRNIEGTGLGINIVVQLLALMNSKLEVKSEYGKGSEFSFVLENRIVDATPIGKFEAEKRDEKLLDKENSKEMIVAPEAKILVVDDNQINLKVFAGLLRDTKIQITQVDSGFKAIEKATKEKFDIIFMDHMMPKMDGIETMKNIRQYKDGPNLDGIIIVLTANAIKGSDNMYLNEGFNDVAFKPATSQQINELLWKYIPSEKIENK